MDVDTSLTATSNDSGMSKAATSFVKRLATIEPFKENEKEEWKETSRFPGGRDRSIFDHFHCL